MATSWLAPASLTREDSAECGFTFTEDGSHAAVCYAGQEILQFEHNVTFFRGAWWAMNQVMTPGDGPEVASVPVFAAFGGSYDVSAVRYEVSGAPEALTVAVIPLHTLRGSAVLQQIQERCTFTVCLEEGRFVWTQQLEIAFAKDIDTTAPEADWISFYRFPHQDGRPGLFLQYADPQPVNASGPAVPMTRDWLFQPEPYVGPESFRLSWQRRYVAIIFQNPDGSFSWSDLNKTKWYHLRLDNRRARPCHANGALYLLKEDGSGLEYRTDAPSHYHHVCEWGMDFHHWLDVEPFLHGSVIPAGTRLVCATTVRLVGREITEPVLRQAAEITLTTREREIADKPAYEEPENSFTVSGLERLDAQVWKPTGEGCRWEKTGGYHDGCGCLVIENNYSNIGAWEQPTLGPSQWGNPFLAGAAYRLSAWVRMEEGECDANDPGPQVGITMQQYNGPASSSPFQRIECGWSTPLIDRTKPLPATIAWHYIELIVPQCPSYVLNATLHLRFVGRGTVYFSNVRWEMIEAE